MTSSSHFQLNPNAPEYFPFRNITIFQESQTMHYYYTTPGNHYYNYFPQVHTQFSIFNSNFPTIQTPPPSNPNLLSNPPTLPASHQVISGHLENGHGNVASTSRGKIGNHKKVERVVKYGTSVSKGQRYDVVPLKSDGSITTVMIRNIPSKYTRNMLLDLVDKHCLSENQKESFKISNPGRSSELPIWSAIDFLYMPMDFKSKWNKGYAFVNFTDSRAVWRFYHACNNKKWDFFHSNKIRQIVSAKIQGKKALVEHFGHTSFECDSDDYLPVCFTPPRDGFRKHCTLVGNRISSSSSTRYY